MSTPISKSLLWTPAYFVIKEKRKQLYWEWVIARMKAGTFVVSQTKKWSRSSRPSSASLPPNMMFSKKWIQDHQRFLFNAHSVYINFCVHTLEMRYVHFWGMHLGKWHLIGPLLERSRCTTFIGKSFVAPGFPFRFRMWSWIMRLCGSHAFFCWIFYLFYQNVFQCLSFLSFFR